MRRAEIEPPGMMRFVSAVISRMIAKANESFLGNL